MPGLLGGDLTCEASWSPVEWKEVNLQGLAQPLPPAHSCHLSLLPVLISLCSRQEPERQCYRMGERGARKRTLADKQKRTAAVDSDMESLLSVRPRPCIPGYKAAVTDVGAGSALGIQHCTWPLVSGLCEPVLLSWLYT